MEGFLWSVEGIVWKRKKEGIDGLPVDFDTNFSAALQNSLSLTVPQSLSAIKGGKARMFLKSSSSKSSFRIEAIF
jgi:hypothetical protein